VRDLWREVVLETDSQGQRRVNRISYELCVLHMLRERLRCKEIWVVGADRYRNPDEDVPTDFVAQRQTYYTVLQLPHGGRGLCPAGPTRNAGGISRA
jgi:hypothetical protein